MRNRTLRNRMKAAFLTAALIGSTLMGTFAVQAAPETSTPTAIQDIVVKDNGKIIYDVEGEKRSKLTISDLMKLFKEASGKVLDNDRMLLS